MSGIEIVGVVLGALPLFLSAAEHYESGLDFARRAIKKHHFVAVYRDELAVQQTLLNLYIKAVVGKTRLSPAVQSELLDSPAQDVWRRPEVVAELTRELGEAYQPFTSLLTRICTTLARQIRSEDKSIEANTDDELVEKLQKLCIKSEKAPSTRQEDVWSRIKFSWKHPRRLTILAELKSYNATLGQLGNAVNRAKPYERKQQTRKVHATFGMRVETEKLYQAISRACNCQPLRPRDVGLGLSVYHQQLEDSGGVLFRVLFFDANDNACVTSVRIERSIEPQEPAKKRVRIVGMTSNKRPEKGKKLHDLCKECQIAQQQNGNLKLFVNEQGELCSSTAASTPRPKKLSKDPMLTLSDLMADFQLYDHKRWLHREKAILAVVLAYSMLQLHESSWWQSMWDSNGISFHGLGSPTKGADQRLRLRRPYTRSRVAEAAASPSPEPPASRNAHLHALGIVLLELYLNRSIKAEADAKGTQDYCGVAQELLRDHIDDMNMTPEYSRAIRFCLTPSPNPRSGLFSFEDHGFRELFYDEVISALEDNLTSRFEVDDHMWSGEPG